MRRTRGLVIGLGLGVGALGAGAVAASLPWTDPPRVPVVVTVSPVQVAPDQHITLSARGCAVPPLASSPAFDSVLLAPDGHSRTLRIDSAVTPGRYRVLLDCNGATATATLLIVAPAAPLAAHAPAAPPAPRAQRPAR